MPFYKVLTTDLRSPIRGGPPIFAGTTPYLLPAVVLDTSRAECAAGWHCTDSLIKAVLLVDLSWKTPLTAWRVTPASDMLFRANKWRASQLTIEGAVSSEDLRQAINGAAKSYISRQQSELYAHLLTIFGVEEVHVDSEDPD